MVVDVEVVEAEVVAAEKAPELDGRLRNAASRAETRERRPRATCWRRDREYALCRYSGSYGPEFAEEAVDMFETVRDSPETTLFEPPSLDVLLKASGASQEETDADEAVRAMFASQSGAS